MAIDALDVLREARSLGSTATLADAQAALDQIDRAALENAERARYRIEIWDKVSPLAGQPASYWLNQPSTPAGGEIYLIYVDDRLVYVQPHDPEQAGIIPMDVATAQARAEAQIARLVEAAVDAQVMKQALMKLL